MTGSGTKNGRVAPAKPEANGIEKDKRVENGKPGRCWNSLLLCPTLSLQKILQ